MSFVSDYKVRHRVGARVDQREPGRAEEARARLRARVHPAGGSVEPGQPTRSHFEHGLLPRGARARVVGIKRSSRKADPRGHQAAGERRAV